MMKLLKSIADVRKGEIGLTLLMFSNYYLLLVTYYLLKPARDSLFLVKVSPEMLPLVFIITALVTAPITTLYSKASRTLKLNRLVVVTIGVIIVNLVVLRWLVQINQSWVYYLFYTWVSIYGALTTSQFWLLANTVFDAAQAKRIFSLLGLGGILGAFTGGEVTSFFVQTLHISTENLLFFCIGFLVVSAVFSSLAWAKGARRLGESGPRRRTKKAAPEKIGQSMKSIFRSRHLSLIVGIIAMTMMVASFVDFQFKTVSFEAFSNQADLTAFLGKFYGRLSLVSLALQMLFAYRFIRWLGVGGVIMFLPIGLMCGSVAMFIVPGLTAAVLLRGADGSLKYSLDKTGRELLFLPVPPHLKARTKIFIDMFVDRWFRGLAGGLLLLCTVVFSLTIQQISLVVIVLLVIWLVFVFMMRKEYVNSFRSALQKRTLDADDIRVNINDTAAVNALIAGLGSSSDRQVVYSLRMVKSVTGVELVWPVLPLLHHRSAEVRRRAMEVLQIHGNEAAVSEVQRLLSDPDVDVRSEVVQFLANRAVEGRTVALSDYLKSDDTAIRNGALACLAAYGDPEIESLLTTELIESILADNSSGAVEGRCLLARALGRVHSSKYAGYLETLLEDSSEEVVREAIAGVGNHRLRRRVPWLLEKLADRRFRADARTALAAYGAGVLGTLNDYLRDVEIDHRIRRNIPRVIREIPEQQSVHLLTTALGDMEPFLRTPIIRALNSLRTRHPELKFDQQELGELLIKETRRYYQITQVLHLHQASPDSPACRLLKRSLIEKQQQNLERIFRLLGLVYPPRDIYNAYLGVVSGRKALHANAIEFLDNLLRTDVKKYVLPILDEVPADVVQRRGKELFDVGYTDREEALTFLINGRDPWLRACAVYAVGEAGSPALLELVRGAMADPDAIVRETARHVMERTG